MALGDKRIDPKTGEPEIEIEGGAWVTDWALLSTGGVVEPLPTSFAITTRGGTVNGNDFTVNGMYRGNNTGPVNGSTFGNWTWRIRVQRIGDYISQHYWNDTGNNGYRESYDGGTTWGAWGV